MRWFPRLLSACEYLPLTCAFRPGDRVHDASVSSVSGWTLKRVCFHVRTILASSTRSLRSVLVETGRFTCRRRIMSCWRRNAFSATSSLLLLVRSVSVPSNSELLRGFVQPRAERWKIWKGLTYQLFSSIENTNRHTHFSLEMIHTLMSKRTLAFFNSIFVSSHLQEKYASSCTLS